MKKLLALSVLIFSLFSVGVLVAHAGAPVITRETLEFDYVDPVLSSTCGFDVQVAGTLNATEKLFFDNDGNPIRVDVHVQYTGTVTNLESGLTLRDPGAFKFTVDFVNNTVTETGMHFAITVPGEGVVVLDAGRLVGDVSSGDLELIFEAGPHQHLHGGDILICEALS
jgi:CBS domain-containing protein